jgi:tetratricopeptide (TPR) repeat protein
MHMQPSQSAESNDPCDSRWDELSRQYVQGGSSADYSALLQAWETLEQACENSPRYRARLSLIYFYLDRPTEAKSALATVSRDEEERESLVQLARILADAMLLRGDPAPESELEALEQRLRVYALKNPRDPVGVSLLGDVLSDLGRDEAAIEAYEAVLKSVGTSARSVGVMRNLTVSYENVARHEDAYRLAGEALSFDRAGLTADLYFMCAAAEAQASLGKMKGARDTLTLLAAKKPELREHPHFKAAVDVVKEKMRANPGE